MTREAGSAAAADKGARRERPARAPRDKAGKGAGRSGATATDKPKLPLVPIIGGAVLVLGVAGYFIFAGGDSDATGPDESTAASATGAAEAPEVTSEALYVDPEYGTVPKLDVPEIVVDVPPTVIDGASAPAAEAPAQAPAPEVAADAADEVLDPVLAYEPLPPMPGTEADFEEWSGWIHAYFVEGVSPREGKELRRKIDELDPIDAAPAFINALIGLDMSDGIDVRNAFTLVEYWQDREGRKMHWNIPDATRMEQKDINNRVKGLAPPKGWAAVWREKMADPEKIEAFRLEVAAKLQEVQSKDG